MTAGKCAHLVSSENPPYIFFGARYCDHLKTERGYLLCDNASSVRFDTFSTAYASDASTIEKYSKWHQSTVIDLLTLTGEKEIRLINLLPGTSDDSISFSIDHVSLTKEPEYEAPSTSGVLRSHHMLFSAIMAPLPLTKLNSRSTAPSETRVPPVLE